MTYVIYALVILFLLMGGGLLMAGIGSRKLGVLVASVAFLSAAYFSYQYVAFWPLIVGFVAVWALRLLGLDPGWKSNGPYDFNDDNRDN